MAVVMRPKQEQYNRLTALTQPEAAPTKRVGTETPVGATTAGPMAGKAPQEFTQTQRGSPGSIFNRQLAGANISGITNLASQPLYREGSQETMRVGQEGQNYRDRAAQARKERPQFAAFDDETINRILNDEEAGKTASNILTKPEPETPDLKIGKVKEFTPSQALRGGTVESLLKREAKGPYSTGMAGLDALLFAKKGGGKELSEKGMALRSTIQAGADELEKAATAEERQKMKELVEGQRTGLMGGLTGRQTANMADFQKRLADEAARRQQAVGGSVQVAKELAIERLLNDPNMPQGEKDAIRNAIMAANVDPEMAKLFGGGAQTFADVASPEEEKQYGKLLTLLNLGGTDVRSMGLGRESPATPLRGAVTREELASPEDKRLLDILAGLTERGLGGAQKFRSENAPLYTVPRPTYGPAYYPGGEMPSDRDDIGARRTTGERTVFRESDLPAGGRRDRQI